MPRYHQTAVTADRFTASVADPAWVLSADEGRWINAVPGEIIRIRVHSSEVGGRFTVVESISQPMAGPPSHVHREDEVFFVEEGVLTFVIDGNRFEAGAGSLVVIPAGAVHAWRNFGDKPARCIVTFTPGGIEELFSRIGETPLSKLPDLAAQYGSAITGPPIEL